MKTLTTLLFLFLSVSIFGQFRFQAANDTIYFMIYHNDTIRLNPMAIPPHAKLTSNFEALGYTHYIADCKSRCDSFILANGYQGQTAGLFIIESESRSIYLTVTDPYGKETKYTIKNNTYISNLPGLIEKGEKYTALITTL
jgi:hypothetical protein